MSNGLFTDISVNRSALIICASVRPLNTEQALSKVVSLFKEVLAAREAEKMALLPLALQTIVSLNTARNKEWNC